jgi:hypothetical protein
MSSTNEKENPMSLDSMLFERLVPVIKAAIAEQSQDTQIELRARFDAGLMRIKLTPRADGWWIFVNLGSNEVTRVHDRVVGLLDLFDEFDPEAAVGMRDKIAGLQLDADPVPDDVSELVDDAGDDDLPPAAA